jgi:hypothetical protein
MLQFTVFILFVIIFCGLGVFGIIMIIDLCDYLKKYHAGKWKEISFERPFGMSQESFFIHPVNPISLISLLSSSEDLEDNNVQVYKKRLKLLLYAFGGVFIILLFLVILF